MPWLTTSVWIQRDYEASRNRKYSKQGFLPNQGSWILIKDYSSQTNDQSWSKRPSSNFKIRILNKQSKCTLIEKRSANLLLKHFGLGSTKRIKNVWGNRIINNFDISSTLHWFIFKRVQKCWVLSSRWFKIIDILPKNKQQRKRKIGLKIYYMTLKYSVIKYGNLLPSLWMCALYEYKIYQLSIKIFASACFSYCM